LIKYSDNWQGDVQKFIDTHTAIILQQFLPNVMEYGDKRVFMIEGEIVGAFSRIPTAGEIRANIAVGGTAFPTKLTTNEIEICNQLSTMLKENDLFFAGIDLLDEHLIEINVTSPTGLTTLMQLGQIDFTDVAEIIERAC
jgi:glutathione synthase